MTAADDEQRLRRLEAHGRFLFLLAVAVLVVVSCWGLGNPILERHAFRQTQTALTALMFLEHGFRLAYETPVLGEPWSIPLEFPLYQAICALLAFLTGASLTAIGRLVSLGFTLACCVPIHFTLLRLGIRRHASFIALAMFLSSPVYLLWSGTFMIESAALFFGLCFLYFAVRISEGRVERMAFAGCAVFLTAALLQKATTALPMILVAGVLVLTRNWRQQRAMQFWVYCALAVAIPLAIGWAWVAWTDAIKAQHPLGMRLTSAALARWNYGLPEDRFSGELWHMTVFNRVVWASSGMLVGLLAVLVVWRQCDARMARLLLGLLALFLLPFLVFTNVHVVHDYYQVANAVFWSLIVGLAVALLMEQPSPGRWRWRPLLAGLIFVLNVDYFNERYDFLKFSAVDPAHRTLQLAAFVQQETPPGLPVIWLGMDWSSEAAFYSQRRSLNVPNWYDLSADMLHARRHLSQRPSAVVNCPSEWTAAKPYRQLIERETGASPVRVADCDVYVLRRRADPKTTLTSSPPPAR